MPTERVYKILIAFCLFLTVLGCAILYTFNDLYHYLALMQNKFDTIQQELNEHKNEFHGINYDSELFNIYSKINTLYGEIGLLYDKIDDLYEKQQSETNNTPSIDNTLLEELQGKTKELETKIQFLEKTIKDFENKTKELENQIKNFENESEEYKDKTHALELKAQEFENRIKALEKQIKEFESQIKEFENKIEELETKVTETIAAATTKEPVVTSPTITNGIYADLEQKYYGRLFILDAGINVALYYGYDIKITDREDSANIFFFGTDSGFTIADHNYQEFAKLYNVRVGMCGYIQHKYDGIINIKCVDIFNGYNNGKHITDENGVNVMNVTDYMMYTCRNNTTNVLICLWEIVPSSKMTNNKTADIIDYLAQRQADALVEINYYPIAFGRKKQLKK